MFTVCTDSSASNPWMTREPTPHSLPAMSINAAPDQLSWGGEVNMASSSTYSQRPANSCLATTSASTTCGSARPLPAIHTASPMRSDSESPIGTLRPDSGIIGLIRARPVRKSLPTTNPGTARPSWEPIQISSASLITYPMVRISPSSRTRMPWPARSVPSSPALIASSGMCARMETSASSKGSRGIRVNPIFMVELMLTRPPFRCETGPGTGGYEMTPWVPALERQVE